MARPGIVESVYLNGVAFDRGPSSVVPNWLTAQSRARGRDGALYIDSLQPEATYPVLTAKLDLSLSWDSMCADDILRVNRMIAQGGPFDICYWRYLTEAFAVAAGLTLAGTLARRNALTVVSPLPTGAAANYPVIGTRGDGTTAFTPTLGAVSNYRTPWTNAAVSAGETVTVDYVPVFRMYVVAGQESFTQPHRQGQTLRFEEM
jgi:hypothetical protein